MNVDFWGLYSSVEHLKLSIHLGVGHLKNGILFYSIFIFKLVSRNTARKADDAKLANKCSISYKK